MRSKASGSIPGTSDLRPFALKIGKLAEKPVSFVTQSQFSPVGVPKSSKILNSISVSDLALNRGFPVSSS